MGRFDKPLLQVREGALYSVVAAHAVDSGAGRRGRRAQVQALGGGGVVAPRGAEEELVQVEDAAGNVAADKVSVHRLESGGGKDAACEDTIAKAGCEAFDLRFDGVEHVDLGAVGDVAIGPGGVLAYRGAGWIEKAGLREQDEGTIGVAAVPHDGFGSGDFFGGAAEMHGGGAQAIGSAPRGGMMERVIDLEGGGAVAELV